MSFLNKLKKAWNQNNSLLCVGLDPEMKKLPSHLQNSKQAFLSFNKEIIDHTAEFACAFKLQIAYYSALGLEQELVESIQYIKTNHPNILIILDAKRNDIGNTARQYAIEAFDRYKADAVTVNPYMGQDSLQPFLERKEKGVIILCHTSNEGAKDFQELEFEGKPLYEHVAEKALKLWNENNNIAFVIGATFPNEISKIRKKFNDVPILIPGIGAQGGDLKKCLQSGLNAEKTGLLINSSRGIIYSSQGLDFASAARKSAEQLYTQINNIRTEDNS